MAWLENIYLPRATHCKLKKNHYVLDTNNVENLNNFMSRLLI